MKNTFMNNPLNSRNKTGDIAVIGVLGLSYCGSTLLNFILDSHPEIYGGGELHWLLNRNEDNTKYSAQCTACGTDCLFWTEERLNAVNEINLYPFISRIFQKRIVVDTSKNPRWFWRMAETSGFQVKFHYLVLTKHPIRHTASLMSNTMINKDLKDLTDSECAIEIMYDFYRRLFRDLKKPGKETVYQVIHYEDLVLDLKNTVRRILKPFKLDYFNSMENCIRHIHHQIGGNAGPLYQNTKKWVFGEDKIDDQKKENYMKQKGIFLDNKYKKTFSPQKIQKLSKDEKVLFINKLLGYEELITNEK
jgi:hypothetical protein